MKSLKTSTGYYNRIGLNIDEFVLTEGQTVVNVNYRVGFIDVIREGLELKPSEYTATNGTSITLTESARKGEVLLIKKELKYDNR
jgi:hypothetical protein